MTPELIFQISNVVAIGGWLTLIVGGRHRSVAGLVTGVFLPVLFALLYGGLILARWSGAQGGFGSLAEVLTLFSNPWLMLAGWLHYLAFDLFIGSWEVRDAIRHRISHLVVVPCLVLTFLLGPLGLCVYFAVRLLKTRTLSLGFDFGQS